MATRVLVAVAVVVVCAAAVGALAPPPQLLPVPVPLSKPAPPPLAPLSPLSAIATSTKTLPTAGAGAGAGVGQDTNPRVRVDTPKSIRPRRCVFVHGAGHNGSVAATFYWENVAQYTPQCTERQFLSLDSFHNAWFDEVLYTQFCNEVAGNEPDRVIRDTILFTYSMGTLVMAAGIESGACSFDKSTSSWNVLSYVSPLKEAMDENMKLFNLGTQVLENEDAVAALDHLRHRAAWMRVVIADGEVSRATLCIIGSDKCTGAYSTERRVKVLKVLQDNVAAIQCGRDPAGVTNDLDLAIVSKLWCNSDNDGAVSLRACQGLFAGTDRPAPFLPHPSSAFFVSRANHFDLPCGSGNGEAFDQRVCDWYSFRG